MTVEPILVTVNQAAAALAIGRTNLYELISSGEVEAVKQKRRTLIRVESLKAYAASLPAFDGVGQ